MLSGTYDFKKVNLLFGIQIEGFEEGTEIVVDRAEDSFTTKVDNDGNVTRSRSNNKLGTITFSLSQFSSSNAYLTNIASLDEKTANGVLPASVSDKSNPSVEKSLATQAWIVKPSAKGYGAESGPREWVLQCADLNYFQF